MHTEAHRKVWPALAMLVFASGCSKAPTEVGEPFPTPTPPLTVDVAGTWQGVMTYQRRSERVTVTFTQETAHVYATWSTPSRGEVRFAGDFLPGRSIPDLAGNVTLQHACDARPFRVGGEPTSTKMVLTGSGLCLFDPVRFTLDLSRSAP